LNPFLDQPLPETPATEALTGDARADQLGALLRDAVRLQTERAPGLLLVEDAQWLDSKSWSLLLDVIESVPRLLTLVTQRIAEGLEEIPAEQGALRAHPAAQVLTLGNLSAEETATLVRQRLRTNEISPAVLSLVLERVSGHPFFCEALLETLIEGGAIRITGQGAQLADHPDLSVPVSIQSALLSRLDRLDAAQQLALKAAAVVGRTCSAAEVAAAHPTAAPAAAQDQLTVLQELELLGIERAEAPTIYTFRHQIIQEVAYGLLTGAQRRQMHGALASFYEAGHRRAAQSGPELLAHHWARAEVPERAAPYLEDAGRRALHHGAFREAVQLLEDAITAAPHSSPERRALQEKALADAHYFLGDMPRSRALLEQALERLGYPIRRGRVELARGLAGGFAHHLLPARRAHTPQRETLLAAVEAMRKLVQISYLHATSTLELSYLIVAGLNLGEQAGPSTQLAEALANAAALAGVCGLNRRADSYADRAIRMAEEHEHRPASAYVWNVVAIMHAGRGCWGLALTDNDRALHSFGPVGDYNLESELWQTRSALQLCRGALPEAEVAWTRTRELAERTGSPVNLCWSLLDQAQTELARAETRRGVRALDDALAIPIFNSDGGTVIERHATTALARLDQGRHAEAVSEADAVIDMLTSRLPTGWVWGEFGVLALEVLLELRMGSSSDVPAAGLDRRIRRGLLALRRLSLTFGGIKARVLILRAQAARLTGDLRAVERHLRAAEACSGREDQQFDRARIDIVRAQLTPDRGRRAELLGEPLRVLEELGQERERRRAEALL
jgi:tetratricopeptide (TPR) repeat protein